MFSILKRVNQLLGFLLPDATVFQYLTHDAQMSAGSSIYDSTHCTYYYKQQKQFISKNQYAAEILFKELSFAHMQAPMLAIHNSLVSANQRYHESKRSLLPHPST